MKHGKKHIAFIPLLIFLISCLGTKSIDKTSFIGNFKENRYEFFESIVHGTANSHSYKIPFDLKFGGIRPYPYDSIGKQEYTWLRNPDNLLIAFNTIKSIGLEKFVSLEQYNKRTNDWCCNTQWENKSLNEIIDGFLHSDTNSSNGNYYSKFWKRRRKEGNLKITFRILNEINDYYNGQRIDITSASVDTVLKGLLTYDLQLATADSNSYQKIAINYFNYLKSVQLEYSAYKLLFHNSKLKLPKDYRDSILSTLNYDTLTYEAWNKMNDNAGGWMTSGDYPDPNRYYGP
jgi:hypothetical protein